MYPRFADPSNSDDEVTNNRKSKLIKSRSDLSVDCNIIHEGALSKLINKHHNLVKRYVVLNPKGLFVYKDDIAFRSFPQKPTVVIPMGEIHNIAQREFSTSTMLKSQSVSTLKG